MEKFIVFEFSVLVPVTMGQNQGYALVDTGGSGSLIFQPFSEGFPKAGTRKTQSLLTTEQADRCRVDRISAFGENFSDIVATVVPRAIGDLGTLPFPVIGTLGIDTLYQKPLYLQFASGKIGFLETVPPELEKHSWLIDLGFQMGFPFFTVGLGSLRLRATLDTGAGYSVLNARWLDALRPELMEVQPEETSDGTGTKAWIPVYKDRGLQIDGYSLGETRFLVADLSDLEKRLGGEIDFILGFNAMMSQDWIVDKPGGRLLLLDAKWEGVAGEQAGGVK
jgi:hypothetical protein